jgi:hypothetical protein
MQHDYTLLNHNSIMSPKNRGHQSCDYKGDLLWYECSSFEIGSKRTASMQFDHRELSGFAGHSKRTLIYLDCFTGSHPIPLLSCD